MASVALSRSELREAERKVVEAAREDINVFTRYVFGIRNWPFHVYLNSIVDGPKRKVTFDAPIAHGKTTQFSVIRPIFALGRDPFEQMALVSSAPELPMRALRVIRNHIEENERLHRVFPKLRLEESTQKSITVARGRTTDKDASIAAMGIEGQILGRRWSWLITDDILRLDTTYTDASRVKVWERLTREVLGRLDPKGRHTDIGTPWVATDARGKLRRMASYTFLRFDGWTGEVFDINGRKVRQFEGGLWPELVKDPISGREQGWPRWRLEEARRDMPGHEFDRQIRGIVLSGAMGIFSDYLDFCAKLGRGIKMQEEMAINGKVRVAWRRPEPSWRNIYTGVDLAIERKDTAADTAFFTGAADDRQRQILELRKGKIEGPDILRNMIEIVRRYPLHNGFRCETNSGQKFLKQFTDEPGLLEALGATAAEADRIRVIPHFTGRNKAAEGVGIRAMNVEFERKRWPIPCDDELVCCELVQEWVDALKTFDPLAHSDDMLVASWLFWEQSREAWVGTGDFGKYGVYVPR